MNYYKMQNHPTFLGLKQRRHSSTKNKTMFIIWLVIIKPYNFLAFVFAVRHFYRFLVSLFDDFFFSESRVRIYDIGSPF